MEKLVVINGFNINQYMFKPFSDGVVPADILRNTLSLLPYKARVVEIHPADQEFTLGFEKKQADEATLEGFWKTLVEIAPTAGEVFLIQGDQPLLDIPMFEEMTGLHDKYFAEYTFADAWPLGLSGEILRGSILQQIAALAVNHHEWPEGSSLFGLIQKDINQFDLETLVAPMDFRPWRLDFTLTNLEGWMLADRFRMWGGQSSRDLKKWIKEQEKDLRLIPSYVQIQVGEQCPQKCSYCPYPAVYSPVTQPGRNMTLENFEILLDKIASINPEAVLSLSPWGEPALHPDIYSMLEAVRKKASFKLVMETSGIGWDHGKLLPLLDELNAEWIVSLDSLDPELYSRLRGTGQQKALAFIDFLEEKVPDKIYVQMVRMEDNEEELERVYTQLRDRKAQLIVQKYDHFNGVLPSRKITDLSPVNRKACWHNKRDLVILVDGRVPLCREDLQCSMPLGNALQEDLLTVWNRGAAFYEKHINEDYPEICGNCDEYYTYNF